MSGSLSPSLPTALPDPAFLAEIQRVLQPYRDAAAGSQDMPSSAPSAVQGMARAVQTPASSDQNPGLPDWASGSRRAPSQPTQPQPQSNGAALSGRVDPQAALGFDPSDVLPAKGTALLNSLPTISQPTAARWRGVFQCRRPARSTRLHLLGRRLGCLPLERIRRLHSSLQEALQGRAVPMPSLLLVLIRLMFSRMRRLNRRVRLLNLQRSRHGRTLVVRYRLVCIGVSRTFRTCRVMRPILR